MVDAIRFTGTNYLTQGLCTTRTKWLPDVKEKMLTVSKQGIVHREPYKHLDTSGTPTCCLTAFPVINETPSQFAPVSCLANHFLTWLGHNSTTLLSLQPLLKNSTTSITNVFVF